MRSLGPAGVATFLDPHQSPPAPTSSARPHPLPPTASPLRVPSLLESPLRSNTLAADNDTSAHAPAPNMNGRISRRTTQVDRSNAAAPQCAGPARKMQFARHTGARANPATKPLSPQPDHTRASVQRRSHTEARGSARHRAGGAALGVPKLIQVADEIVPIEQFNHFPGRSPRDQSRLTDIAWQKFCWLQRVAKMAIRAFVVTIVVIRLQTACRFS